MIITKLNSPIDRTDNYIVRMVKNEQYFRSMRLVDLNSIISGVLK